MRPRGLNTGQVGAGTLFNPEISVILDGVFYWDDEDGDIPTPAGFGGGHHHHGHGHDHAHGELDQGFNLRETEIVFAAAIDNYLDAVVTLAIEGDSGIEVEEAYAVTRALPAGFQMKFGKFLSDVGYINKQHPHDWDFVDRPLMNELLFGDHGLQEKGVQVSWVPATPFYTRLGVEVLQGETSGVANYVGSGRHEIVGYAEGTGGTPDRLRWRTNYGLDDVDGPRLFTGFAKFAPDLGYEHALQVGVFGGYARSFQDVETHSSGRVEAWDGDGWFAGTDWVYRYDAGRSYGHGDWRLQAEYMYRRLSLDYFEGVPGEVGSTTSPEFQNRETRKNDGLYIQAVYGFAPRWSAGLRYDVVGLTNNDGYDSFDESHRYSANVTFTATEFSRFRLQVNHGRYEEDDDHGHGDFTQVMLQYNLSLGAHGAHSF
ncbi:zinc-regulated TonB-dependent outer membrane receptor [Alkalilimnicola ehrlichii]|uniref:Zinc-regulated TonB-dependent outer membrane receptor n=1 Tax=Alkalilimnicola ehrlichii TaxID=351052 RepID=A0A3E0WQC0_9GAMM|nr:zinc-regulated TonB-dependent outer membrane receptor [Alkalilimnicola ehrlichii]RFA34165.1 zinc-regulated TonB-dependent outer membrane receptor [Alkalilimnicola ehrlichii]